MPDEIRAYLKSLEREFLTGKAAEHSYRPALKTLIESLRKKVQAINDGRRVAVGAPDLSVSLNTLPVGYIACKDIGVSLDETARSEQMKRYLKSLPNLILTDYLEFRWYREGAEQMRVVLGRIDGKKVKALDAAEAFRHMMDVFLDFEGPTISTPKDLAEHMARMTQLVREFLLKVPDGRIGERDTPPADGRFSHGAPP